MINATNLATFPGCPTFGFTSRPQYLVKHVQMEGGYEQSDLKWEEPLHVYEGVPMGQRPQKDIEAVLRFYHAMRGNFRRFRFKDWADFKSCALDASPSPIDQPIVQLAGSPSGYRLYKRYEAEGFQTLRQIILPVGNTIRIANAAGTEQPASTWTVDENNGSVTPTGGFSGVPTYWGGEFFVYCRFDGDLPTELSNWKIQSATVTVVERRPGT